MKKMLSLAIKCEKNKWISSNNDGRKVINIVNTIQGKASQISKIEAVKCKNVLDFFFHGFI